MKSLLWLLIVCHVPLALAHEGHGIGGAHWHATDALGFVVLGVIVGAALWLTRRR